MPHLRVRGLAMDAVARLSKQLIPELAAITQSDEASYTLEWIPSQFFQQGEVATPLVMVEVLWFQRNETTQDALAACIRTHLTAETDNGIAVVFLALDKRGYYRDGRHF
ncbi:DUF1904 family protein [Shewanella sp. JM162201]|uniref:DUF1904 family protein n=1 Tax=Shewanella jiangmenensis TaxID=2837387 RepID=A0ABS5V4U3_9GAMM|nr:DUF1904 domain-containing protein [Shewanella jiangmenensis]MBT1445482.1 DUF1904 family protein [Shewanella jiangmenensis]